MSKITITITLDVPEGTQIHVETAAPQVVADAVPPLGVPAEVEDLLSRLVPKSMRPHAHAFLERCVVELGCSLEMPEGERRLDYINLYPPQHCRRSRVAALTYSSTRTAIYTGPIDLVGYTLAQRTMNSGVYAYPKLPHLTSDRAIDEAIALVKIAIARLER